MASELLYVIKNRNRYEKEEETKRKENLESLKQEGLFRVALNNKLDIIRNIFEDGTIESVELTIDPEHMGDFGAAFGYEEVQTYDMIQKLGTVNTYIVRKKEIDLY